MGQILQYELTPPENNIGDDIRYMVTKFIPSVRECLKNGGFAKVENGQDSGGEFLVGYKGNLYQVCEDFQVLQNTHGKAAIGCGAPYALGALEAMRDIDTMNTHEKVIRALEIAGTFSAGVCGPYYCIIEDLR